MNRYFLALALSLYGVVCFAQDRREVDETKDADPNGTVTIEIVRGEVQVRGWNRDQVRVSGRLDERMEEFVFEVRDDETEIEVKLPRHLNGWQSGSSDLQISVPENSSLQVNGVSTDVEVVDIKGGVRAHSVSGEVDVANVAKRIDLSSVSGSVNLRDVDGRIRARTVSGDIDGRDVIGHGNYDSVSGSITLVTSGEVLDVESVSGSIELTLQDINEVTGNTVSGDIEISGDLQKGGNIDLESISGTVELVLDTDTDARFDIETGSGGRIRNRLTNDQPKVSKYSRDSMLRFVMGDGSGEVVISTASGRVVLDSR